MAYDEKLNLRITSGQKSRLEAEAKAAGMKPGDFARKKLFPDESPESPAALYARVDTLTRAMSSIPGGTDALAAAEQATSLINREDSNDNGK